MARQEGLEPPTYCLEGSCSIQLSYWRMLEPANKTPPWWPHGPALSGPSAVESICEASIPKNPYLTDGAGDGNRTHATSLEGWDSAIELHPQLAGIATE